MRAKWPTRAPSRVVLEALTEPLAQRITAAIKIPTIGIGASRACDGQILVMEDMLGLSPRVPRFVKKFGKIGEVIEGRHPRLRRGRARARLPDARAHLRHGGRREERQGRLAEARRGRRARAPARVGAQGHEKAEKHQQQGLKGRLQAEPLRP